MSAFSESRLKDEGAPDLSRTSAHGAPPSVERAIATWGRSLGHFIQIMTTRSDARVYHARAFLASTEGKTLQTSLRTFRATRRGDLLARQRPDSLSQLQDNSRLEGCPRESLGRYYLEFKRAHGLDEDYYALSPISTVERSRQTEAHVWYRARFENSHDLRHLLTGYPPDRSGEVCLMSFRAGQTGHLGSRCLAFLGLLHLWGSWGMAIEAYYRGRRARLVDLLIWEDRLDEPLAVVRASLNLAQTKHVPKPCAPEAYLDPEDATSEASGSTIDLADTFGPMSAMHAALDAAGAGMPCGVVARFRDRTVGEIDAAVAAAAARFPVMRARLVSRASRPTLEGLADWRPEQSRVGCIALDFTADSDSPLWRYALTADGDDVRLSAIWAHAGADGRSMLHFLSTVNAALRAEPWPIRVHERARVGARFSMARWLPRFLLERALPYARLSPRSLDRHGVSWMVLPRTWGEAAMARARAEGGGFAAWLAAAASLAFCEQQRGSLSGWAPLNLLVSRGDARATGGFGFAAGSLLIAVRLGPGADMGSVARDIFTRQRKMLSGAWDEHLERFIGRGPIRRRVFARFAREASTPPINVSWKGVFPEMGGPDGVADIACFAASNAAHVSAHMDANGLSISVASRQTPADREALLRRIGGLIHGAPVDDVATLSL